MREGGHTQSRNGLRCAIRDRLYAIAGEYRAWSYGELRHQVRELCRIADLAGFTIVSGVARALEEALETRDPNECLAIYIPYLTRSLALEPCTRDREAVLSLLQGGIERRLTGARLLQTA